MKNYTDAIRKLKLSSKSKEFLQFNPGKLVHGLEQFNRHKPQRAATAHMAQAIHLSQKIFGVNPAGTGDSLLFLR
jgi:hypothetical protein